MHSSSRGRRDPPQTGSRLEHHYQDLGTAGDILVTQPLMGFPGPGVKTYWPRAIKDSCPATCQEPFLLGLEEIIDGNNYSPIPSKAGFHSTKCAPLMDAESH